MGIIWSYIFFVFDDNFECEEVFVMWLLIFIIYEMKNVILKIKKNIKKLFRIIIYKIYLYIICVYKLMYFLFIIMFIVIVLILEIICVWLIGSYVICCVFNLWIVFVKK